MNGGNIASQVKIWSLAGPMSCLLAFFVIFAKGGDTPLFLPLALLIGVPICWRFKLWGFAFCVALIFLSLFYKYEQIPLDYRFWFLGMGIAVLGALFIYTLANDEVEAIVAAEEQESKNRLETLWRSDEREKAQIETLKRKEEEIAELKLKLKYFRKLMEISENKSRRIAPALDLASIERRYEKLLKRFAAQKPLRDDLEGRLKKRLKKLRSENFSAAKVKNLYKVRSIQK